MTRSSALRFFYEISLSANKCEPRSEHRVRPRGDEPHVRLFSFLGYVVREGKSRALRVTQGDRTKSVTTKRTRFRSTSRTLLTFSTASRSSRPPCWQAVVERINAGTVTLVRLHVTARETFQVARFRCLPFPNPAFSDRGGSERNFRRKPQVSNCHVYDRCG